MKKRIVSFFLAAMLGAFGCMPILDVRAEPETSCRGILYFGAETIRKNLVRDYPDYAQSDSTEDLAEDWNYYSVDNPRGKYNAEGKSHGAAGFIGGGFLNQAPQKKGLTDF